MMIQLTRHCSEGCSHCFANSTQSNEHMSWSMLESILLYIKHLPVAEMEFISSHKLSMLPTNLVVTGGEPTEHPQFDDFIIRMAEVLPHMTIIVESNGSWIHDEEKKRKMKRVLELDMLGMVFNASHHKYYPNYTKFMTSVDKLLAFGLDIAKSISPDTPDEDIKNKVVVDTDWQDKAGLIQLGRASELKLEEMTTPAIPNCMQLTYIAQEQINLTALLVSLEHRGLFTSPVFSTDGNIYPGFSHLCTPVGQVCTTGTGIITGYTELYKHLRDSFEPCGKCNLNSRIPEKVSTIISQNRRLRVEEDTHA